MKIVLVTLTITLSVMLAHQDNKIKTLENQLNEIEVDWCFLFVGHWLQGGLGNDRKDLGMLLKTFLETFKNQPKRPALILKTSGAAPSILDREEIVTKVNQIKNTVDGTLPNIYVLHGDLEDDEMNGLYNHPKVKAHVSFTHGEGFGRPLLEASLSGKPVIASNWSGHVDFLPKNLSILLDGSLSEVKKGAIADDFKVDGQKWFVVNYTQAVAVLKDVYKSYKKYTFNAKKLATINKSKFSLDAMTRQLGKILDKYVPEFPEEVKLELPKLKKVGSTDEPAKVQLPKLKKV